MWLRTCDNCKMPAYYKKGACMLCGVWCPLQKAYVAWPRHLTDMCKREAAEANAKGAESKRTAAPASFVSSTSQPKSKRGWNDYTGSWKGGPTARCKRNQGDTYTWRDEWNDHGQHRKDDWNKWRPYERTSTPRKRSFNPYDRMSTITNRVT